MLLTEEEVNLRINSPLNLINQIKSPLELFGAAKPAANSPASVITLPPTIDELVDNIETKLRVAKLHDGALGVMADCVDQLKVRIGEVDKPEGLAQIAANLNKVVTSIHESRTSRAGEGQVIIYKPVIMNESHYETIHVNE